MFIKSFTTMTNIFLKIMPATAANIPQKALKGRPDVMHGCNPCTNKPQANHGCNPCNNHSRAPRVAKTLLLALLLALLAPRAARAQQRDCNGPIAVTPNAPYTQGFEDGVIPDCWDVYPTTGSFAPSVNNDSQHSGSYSLRFREIGYAVLPEFSNPLDELQISFWIRRKGQLQLGYITAEDDGTCNTFTAIADYTASGSWVQYTNYLLNVPATAHRLAFKVISNINYTLFVDDVEVSVIPLGFCSPVGNLGLGRVASNSAYLSWEVYDAEQTAWDVQVATDANFTENVANLEADSHENYLVEGLDPDTYYYVRVKPSCSDDLWSSTIQFWIMPPCNGPITVTADAPYTEGFENPEGTNYNVLGRLPACWESFTTGSVGPHNTTAGSANVHGGSQSLSFKSESRTDTYYAILPEFSNPFNELQISFWLKYSWGLLQLGYITAEDEGNCNTFTAIADFGAASTWTQHTAYLLNMPEAAHRLAFKFSESVMSCYVDDVEVSICTLDCYPVGNLSVEGLSSTSAYLSWALIDNSQTAWNVQLATDAAFTDTVAEYVADTHENFLIDGLSRSTTYYVRVKPVCDDDKWSDAINFTTSYFGGSGIETDPYIIATTDDMDALAASVNGGNDYEGVYFRQTDNLDYEGKTYTPVGTPTHPFRGIFDGRSYTISHVTLGNNNDNQGLFGYVENATLSYIRLANSQISAKDCVGGIVGHGSGTIESCYVEDDVVVLGHEDVGGIIGNFSRGNILFCENSATVAAESNYLGGIAGHVDANPHESASISYCFNYGTIGFYNFGKYGNFLGGIVGRFSGYNGNPGINNDYRLEGCINHGSVYGYNYRGGIAGFTDRISVIDNLSLGYVMNGDYGPGAIVSCSNGGSMDYYSNNYYAGNASCYLSNAIGSLSGDEPNEAMRGWIVSEGEGIFVQLMPDEDYNFTGLTYDGITYLGAGQTGYFIIGRLDGSAGNFTVSAGTLTPVSSEEYENYYALTMPTEGQDVTISSLDIALTVPGYDTNPDAGWKLIASPVVGSIEAETVGNIFLWEYDLFRFSPSEALEWRNYKNEPFELVNGQGYLYASDIDITLLFGGTYNEAATHDVPLEYDPADSRKCWNLVGNPFPCEAYLDRAYYVLSANGTDINPNAIPSTVPVPPCTAVFVKSVTEGDSVVFTRAVP
ncbi:MAG: hypothetical protein IKH61_04100 [Bacteroidales bacterium]|nr:hypothetical protein [Bacteroidales bacterium]